MLACNNIIKHLNKFQKKRTPESGRISLVYENAIHYDMYSVYIKTSDDSEYLFDSFTDGMVHARKWDAEENRFHIATLLAPENLKSEFFSGIYYYHAHELRFQSLNDLTWFREFMFRRWSDRDNKKFSRERYLYRQQRKEITDTMAVLASIVRIYREQEGSEPFSEYVIMDDVAGKLWIHHDDKARMKKELRLCLDSLVENGDISRTQYAYKPAGKAMNTLSRFNKDEQRYNDDKSGQRTMRIVAILSMIVAVASAVAAIASAYVSFQGLNHTPKPLPVDSKHVSLLRSEQVN
ncbi:TPA: hypothetical protein ACWYF9_004125 [Citrobacter braakii]